MSWVIKIPPSAILEPLAVIVLTSTLIEMTGKIKYSFSEKVWQHSGLGGWYFVSLPENMSKEIREMLRPEEEGWGRLKATVQTGKSEWKTAIWFDSKKNTYLLGLKAEIRKDENIDTGKIITVTVLL